MTAHYAFSAAANEKAIIVLTEGLEYALREGLLGLDQRSTAGAGLHPLRLTRAGEQFIATNGRAASWRDLAVRELLHPVIAADALIELERGVKHHPDAIFKAFKAVEIAVREASGLSDADIGAKLMTKAFNPGGPLASPNRESGEQAAIAALFAGAIGTYKNPHSHREATNAEPTALRALMLASELLYMTEEAGMTRSSGS